MRLLLTNDDGIDAPGLQALMTAAQSFGEICVVAPAQQQSGCGHRVTTNSKIRVEQRKNGQFAVHGTPADCVRLALYGIVPKFDWVLSGINEGGNLGADVYISGTVSAVREAAFHGIPGIALSQYLIRDLPADWSLTARRAKEMIAKLLAEGLDAGTMWNVNLPHLSQNAPEPLATVCPLELQPLPLHYRPEGDGHYYNADYHGRPRHDGSDVDVCFKGGIAVTRLVLGG